MHYCGTLVWAKQVCQSEPGPRSGTTVLCTWSCGRTREVAIVEMLPLVALWWPELLQLAKQKDKQDEWSTTVMQTLEAEELGDLGHFAFLYRANSMALTCASYILGMTGGRLLLGLLAGTCTRCRGRGSVPLRTISCPNWPGALSLGQCLTTSWEFYAIAQAV